MASSLSHSPIMIVSCAAVGAVIFLQHRNQNWRGGARSWAFKTLRFWLNIEQMFGGFHDLKGFDIAATINRCEILFLTTDTLYSRSLIHIEVDGVTAHKRCLCPLGHDLLLAECAA